MSPQLDETHEPRARHGRQEPSERRPGSGDELSSADVGGLKEREARLEAGPGPPGRSPGGPRGSMCSEGTGGDRRAQADHCEGRWGKRLRFHFFIYSTPCVARLRGEAGNSDFIPKPQRAVKGFPAGQGPAGSVPNSISGLAELPDVRGPVSGPDACVQMHGRAAGPRAPSHYAETHAHRTHAEDAGPAHDPRRGS